MRRRSGTDLPPKSPPLPPRWFIRVAWIGHRAMHRLTGGRRGPWDFDCIPSFWDSTNGYVVQCVDGTFSHSGGRQGVCSYHHGYRRTLFDH